MKTTTVWIIYTQIVITIKQTCIVNNVLKIHQYDTSKSTSRSRQTYNDSVCCMI